LAVFAARSARLMACVFRVSRGRGCISTAGPEGIMIHT
jgi:hypothetical protein